MSNIADVFKERYADSWFTLYTTPRGNRVGYFEEYYVPYLIEIGYQCKKLNPGSYRITKDGFTMDYHVQSEQLTDPKRRVGYCELDMLSFFAKIEYCFELTKTNNC